METESMRLTEKIKNIIVLQGVIIIYTLAGVAGKFASRYDFLSTGFILSYGMEIIILGIYAFLWQQILKRFDLSVAYANRAIALIWSLIWAAVIFQEHITVPNIVGALIVIAGTIIVNGAEKDTTQDNGEP